jgi:hypothetical protein
MSRLTLSTEHWPIVVTTLTNGATDQDYDAYFAAFGSKVLNRRQKFTSLVDVSGVSEPPTAAQRKKIADWQKAEVEIGTRYNVGIAMIFTSRVVRGALTALHWLFPPPTITVTFGTRLEAYDWCIERLDETGVPVPSNVRELAGRAGLARSTGTR